MNLTLEALLAGLIDYAGLFPPAALDMPSAVGNYATYRRSTNARWLARFVVPVARLEEFEYAVAGLSEGGRERDTWLLSALAGTDLNADLKQIANFNEQMTPERNAFIDAIEIKVARPEDIEHAMTLLPEGVAPYFEIPIADDPTELIETMARVEARAKVRTGGVTADAFPSSLHLARFIKICADEDVPFKATAGLHHPLRSVNRLTNAPDSATALMHGFLNVFLAAAFAQNGMPLELLVEVLEERASEAFQFESGSVTWRGEMLVRGQLRNARSLLGLTFGSCSFTEPIEDLQRLGLL